MGGTIVVDSEVGRGTTFTVTLALELPTAAEGIGPGGPPPGVAEPSPIREMMRQIGVLSRSGG